MFVNGMSAIAADAEAIEHRNTHRGQKVSVRRAADLRFTKLKIQMPRNRARFPKQLDTSRGGLNRRPVDAARDKHFRPFVNRLELGKDALDFHGLSLG